MWSKMSPGTLHLRIRQLRGATYLLRAEKCSSRAKYPGLCYRPTTNSLWSSLSRRCNCESQIPFTYRYMEKDLEEEEWTNRNNKRPLTPSPGHALPTALAAPLARRSQQAGQRWEYARVNQSDFEAQKPNTLVE